MPLVCSPRNASGCLLQRAEEIPLHESRPFSFLSSLEQTVQTLYLLLVEARLGCDRDRLRSLIARQSCAKDQPVFKEIR